MNAWTLILLVYAGAWSKTDSVALTNITGFDTQKACIDAGNKARTMTTDTYKETKFVCVQVTK